MKARVAFHVSDQIAYPAAVSACEKGGPWQQTLSMSCTYDLLEEVVQKQHDLIGEVRSLREHVENAKNMLSSWQVPANQNSFRHQIVQELETARRKCNDVLEKAKKDKSAAKEQLWEMDVAALQVSTAAGASSSVTQYAGGSNVVDQWGQGEAQWGKVKGKAKHNWSQQWQGEAPWGKGKGIHDNQHRMDWRYQGGSPRRSGFWGHCDPY